MKLLAVPGVRSLAIVDGEIGILAMAEVATPECLDATLDMIGRIDGVLRTRTALVLKITEEGKSNFT